MKKSSCFYWTESKNGKSVSDKNANNSDKYDKSDSNKKKEEQWNASDFIIPGIAVSVLALGFFIWRLQSQSTEADEDDEIQDEGSEQVATQKKSKKKSKKESKKASTKSPPMMRKLDRLLKTLKSTIKATKAAKETQAAKEAQAKKPKHAIQEDSAKNLEQLLKDAERSATVTVPLNQKLARGTLPSKPLKGTERSVRPLRSYDDESSFRDQEETGKREKTLRGHLPDKQRPKSHHNFARALFRKDSPFNMKPGLPNNPPKQKINNFGLFPTGVPGIRRKVTMPRKPFPTYPGYPYPHRYPQNGSPCQRLWQ
eukprot:GHVP01025706.1.p1 GENE.GHVP01025706.1~~GHVP01025706.1.p1  ORF type:complete len:312 (+),score=63.11 GHVP01025706.1:22-957(+)